ncbi:hypothetical protein [Actinoplanes sp. NPDC049599]|uniref:hypothetical protein n=1 Tax=Actinoplanes sp. NPDC049599 TaxID=3363903 RepID=UPI0037AB65EC
MTPVGVALIVGGITTLIVFRAALFRSARREQRAGEARRRAGMAAEPRTGAEAVDRKPPEQAARRGGAAPPVEASAPHSVPGPDRRRSRGSAGRVPTGRPPDENHLFEAPAAITAPARDEPGPAYGPPTDLRLMALGLPGDDGPADDPGEPADHGGDPELDIDQDLDRAADPARADERSYALDLPGLALPEAELSGPFDAVAGSDGTGTFPGSYDGSLADADETGFVPVAEGPAGAGWAERSDLRYGDRVEGWVRPQYQDEPEPVAGDYWTPAPAGSYETEYGWPTPVERLPEVPPYPPATGFDVPAEADAEPTRPVLQWPPARPDDRIELPRSWSRRDDTGPAFRTPVERDQPADPRPAAELPPEPGRFGSEAAYQQENPAGRRRFEEADDRVFLGEQGLVLAANPHAGEPARRDEPAEARPVQQEQVTGRGRPGRVPARRGPSAGGPYAAREESLEGPIWTVPDLPDAAMPDFTWSPEDDGRRSNRPTVVMRRRRGPAGARAGDDATQMLPPMDLSHPDPPRARPRPRPRPGNGPVESRSTVYVSRHAAEPS